METNVKGYMMSYWPDSGPFSSVTMVNYGLIEIFFDENDVNNSDSKFRWSYEDIGSIKLKEPVDNIHRNAEPLHIRLREVLASKGKFKPETLAERCYFMKLENIACIEEAAKLVGIRIMDDYLANKADVKVTNRLN